jgi:hypothetical protein
MKRFIQSKQTVIPKREKVFVYRMQTKKFSPHEEEIDILPVYF